METDDDKGASRTTAAALVETGRPTTRLPWRHALRQVAVSCIAHSVVIHAGINMSFSAILLPQLRDGRDDIQLSKDEASWIASIMAISVPLGSLTIGPLMDRFGRRRMLFVTCVPFALSWLLHAFAVDFVQLLAARVLAGFSGGLSTVALVYVSEITHPKYRPMLLSLQSVFVSFGILLTCALGLLLPWRHLALVNCAIILVTALLLLNIPESPHWSWLFRQDELATANSLRSLYKNPQVYDVQKRAFFTETFTASQTGDGVVVDLVENLKSPAVYRPLIVVVLIFLIQQLSLGYVVIFYALDLFRAIGEIFGGKGGNINEFVALVVLGLVRFTTACLSTVVSKKIGRRKLFFVSGFGMTLSSAIAWIYTYWKTSQRDELTGLVQGNEKIPLVCLLVYLCFSSLGYLVIPWTLIGELLPVKVRAKLGGMVMAYAYVLMFVTVKVFPSFLELVKIQSMFFLLLSISVVGSFFIYFRLPETLGKTFSEIEAHFQ